MPVLAFAAMDSRQNDPLALAAGAARLADATVVQIDGASHFMIPQELPDKINSPPVEFLRG